VNEVVFIAAFPEGPDPDKDTYEVDVHATLMRLRFPAIIRQARETFGDDVCRARALSPVAMSPY